MHDRRRERRAEPAARNATVAWLEAEHAAVRGWDADRAAAVGAERERAKPKRDSDRGAGRATASEAVGVVWIAWHSPVRIRAERREAKLGHRSLTENDRPGISET